MQEEKYTERERSYSAWHRRNSTQRFVGIEKAQLLSMIDLDAAMFVEYDEFNKQPLALIETAQDVGQPYKTATVTLNLAIRAELPCYVVLYTLAEHMNPADAQWRDIAEFRIKRLHPKPDADWRILTPQEYAEKLLELRKWSARKLDNEYHMDHLLREHSASYTINNN